MEDQRDVPKRDDLVPDTLRRLREGAVGEPQGGAAFGLPDPPPGRSYMLDGAYLRREAEVTGQLVPEARPSAPSRGEDTRSLQSYWSVVAGCAVVGLFIWITSSCNPLAPEEELSHITTEGSVHEGGKQ